MPPCRAATQATLSKSKPRGDQRKRGRPESPQRAGQGSSEGDGQRYREGGAPDASRRAVGVGKDFGVGHVVPRLDHHEDLVGQADNNVGGMEGGKEGG